MEKARTTLLLALALTVAVVLGAAGCGQRDEPDGSTPPPDAPRTSEAVAFTLVSPAFEDGEAIPVEYARQGVDGGLNVSPPLVWSDLPAGTESLALVMVDRHPAASEWVHWMVVDISSEASGIAQGASGNSMPAGSRELENTWGTLGYGGPQPPAGSGDHEYETTVYALDVPSVALDASADFTDFLEAIRDHLVGSATLSGHFGR